MKVKADPCPFCGGDQPDPPQMGRSAIVGSPPEALPDWKGDKLESYIECVKCGVTGPLAWTDADAVKAWNHRTRKPFVE